MINNKPYHLGQEKKYKQTKNNIKVPSSYALYTTAHPWCDGHSTSINACRRGMGQGLSLQEGVSHTYTLKLGQSRNSILYKKKKNGYTLYQLQNIHHCTPLVPTSISAYGALGGGKGQGLSLQEEASHIYTLRLDYNRISILYKK